MFLISFILQIQDLWKTFVRFSFLNFFRDNTLTYGLKVRHIEWQFKKTRQKQNPKWSGSGKRRPRDMQPLGVVALQIHGFELNPKNFKIRWFYVDFSQVFVDFQIIFYRQFQDTHFF